jgi:hypothetical protein
MRQDGRQGGGKSEAVGQHIFRAGLAQLFTKPIVPVQDLADNRLGARSVHVALFHRRTGRKPSAGIHIALELREISREILLHETVPVGAAEIENIMGVFLEQLEIILHRFANILADHLRIFPTPLRIQVCVTNHVERRLSC